MPKVGKSYAMNPAVARRKASDAGDNDADDITPTNASNDQDTDDLIPDDHQLDDLTIKPAENGYTVRHTTRLKPGKQVKRDKHGNSIGPEPYDYRGRERVFENKSGAAGHAMKVMSAHEASKRKK